MYTNVRKFSIWNNMFKTVAKKIATIMTLIVTYIVMLSCFLSKRDAQVTDPMPFICFNSQ